jgi:PAS domain S-box-containing protein
MCDELNLTFENAPISMALVSPEGRRLRVSDSLCQVLGYMRDEMLATDFQHVTHPDDLDADLTLVRQLLGGTQQTYQLPKRYLHRDGRVIS